ncbi:MAG TPA: hypothetical protein VEC37_08475 [Bacillota bacterium]|nr:hypothetical protein [Bacillota bacterium]
MPNREKDNNELSEAMRLKRNLVLNAMDDPGGVDTALTAADQPIAQGAENLNAEKR